jgi:16S rRNA (cytidine1402-2'-O)-methyltransferase
VGAEVAALMQVEGLSEKDALKRVARERGMGKSEAYRELQREQGRLR